MEKIQEKVQRQKLFYIENVTEFILWIKFKGKTGSESEIIESANREEKIKVDSRKRGEWREVYSPSLSLSLKCIGETKMPTGDGWWVDDAFMNFNHESRVGMSYSLWS